MTTTKNIVILAAGGQGTRIDASLPKQYHLLQHKPVLMHTIEAFSDAADTIIVVIHENMRHYWKELCERYNFSIAHVVVSGGASRFSSVKNGLQFIKNNYPYALENVAIAVHDAARPLVDKKLIEKSFALCHQGKGNVLAVKSTNSVRLGTQDSSSAIDRDTVWLIQTPQTFPAQVLLKAFEQEEKASFTDEASVVEELGYNTLIIASHPKNIKITYPEDFAIAQSYLSTSSNNAE